MADHNEAMRLAYDLNAAAPWADGHINHEAAALLRKQAEELDTLRAEVERLKREKAHAIDTAGLMLAAGIALSNGAFNLKQRVGEPLSTHDISALDSAQRAWDAAMDNARKAMQ